MRNDTGGLWKAEVNSFFVVVFGAKTVPACEFNKHSITITSITNIGKNCNVSRDNSRANRDLSSL